MTTTPLLFSNCYSGKTVLVTGHTGFKGSWLTEWLGRLGATVVGLSREVPTTPSYFEACNLETKVTTHWGDIRDQKFVAKVVLEAQPDFIFHLAAQALVRKAYEVPTETVETNVLGTMYVLEAARSLKKTCQVVLITSDKAYDNVEWSWGYRENDALGGKDPYSASKGAAELIIKSYVHSFFTAPECPVQIAVTRAGNVIGGGDWAADRIVPDCVRAWSRGEKVEIRNPHATRPWQHVLEPLSGYLQLGACLARESGLHGEAFNFGPKAEHNFSVAALITELSKSWAHSGWIDRSAQNSSAAEAKLLKLNCDKALHRLSWLPTLSFEETAAFTADWYREFSTAPKKIADFSRSQIAAYERLGAERARIWSR